MTASNLAIRYAPTRAALAAAFVIAAASGCPMPPTPQPVPPVTPPATNPQSNPLPPNQCVSASDTAFEISSHQVSGRVLGNLYDFLRTSPEIVFQDENTGAKSRAPLREGAFTIELPTGDYSVAVSGGHQHYSSYGEDARVIATNLRIKAETTDLEFDLDLVTRDIELTFGGDAFPEHDTDRGSLIFTGVGIDERITRPLPLEGEARVRVALPAAGLYQVVWQRRFIDATISDFQNASVAQLPYGEVELQSIVVSRWTDTMPPLVYDVSAVTTRLNAEVLVDGGAFPSNDVDDGRGVISVGNLGHIAIEQEGAVAFSLSLVPGFYDVSLQSWTLSFGGETTQYERFSLCGSDTERCDDGLCDFSASTDWSASISPFTSPATSTFEATISSETTYRCAQVQPVRGGRLVLRNVETGGRIRMDIDDTGSISNDSLAHGIYDIWYEQLGVIPNTPSGVALLQRNFVFFDDARFENTILASSAYIELTRNGAPLPDDDQLDGEPRGFLSLVALDDAGVAVGTIRAGSLGETGPGTVNLEVVDGSYNIIVSTVMGYGKGRFRYTNQSVLPDGRRRVGTHTFTGADMDFVPVDVSVVEVDISFAGVEDGDDDEADVGLVGFRDEHGNWQAARLDSEMTVALYAGDYDVVLYPDFAVNEAVSSNDYGLGSPSYMGTLCVGSGLDDTSAE